MIWSRSSLWQAKTALCSANVPFITACWLGVGWLRSGTMEYWDDGARTPRRMRRCHATGALLEGNVWATNTCYGGCSGKGNGSCCRQSLALCLARLSTVAGSSVKGTAADEAEAFASTGGLASCCCRMSASSHRMSSSLKPAVSSCRRANSFRMRSMNRRDIVTETSRSHTIPGMIFRRAGYTQAVTHKTQSCWSVRQQASADAHKEASE